MIILFRLFAFMIDYLILACYGVALFGFVMLVGLDKQISSPWIAQLTGFLSLTLPVVLYFSILENSRLQATVGKRVMRLKVTDENVRAASLPRLLKRNALKFLPWEIAHLGVHWAFYYNRLDTDPANWVWGCLLSSQALLLVYLISVVLNSNHQGLYERWSGTRVTRVDFTARDSQDAQKMSDSN